MPLRDKKGYLWDVAQASHHILDFVADKSFSDYQQSLLLRSAVERQFEIIGEALNQCFRFFPDLQAKISAGRQIISFRNRLIHGYADVDDAVVWGVLEEDLPLLLKEVEALLNSAP